MNTLRRILVVLALLSITGVTYAQSSAFSYQGRLADNGAAADGTHDLTFTLYDAASGGATVGVSNGVNDLAVTNGLFTVALDFGAAAFDGNARWLEIAVRPGTNTGAYAALTPRQPITSTPYAVRAANLTGTLPLSQLPAAVVTNNATGLSLTGAFTGSGAGVSNVNAATLGGLSSTGFWRTNGNSGANPTNGAFLGTADRLPVELKVNGQRALRLEPTATANAVNVIGGSPSNSVAPGVEAATIAGGGLGPFPNSITASYATIGGGTFHQAEAGWSTIAGGRDNRIEAGAEHSTIAGGGGNVIRTNAWRGTVAGGVANAVGAPEGTVSGGAFNSALAFSATIGGGGGNAASGEWSTIAGGRDNLATNAPYAAIPGGRFNRVAGSLAFAAGYRAKANHPGAFVWADANEADFASTANNQFLIRASGGVGLGTPNPQAALHLYSANNPATLRLQSAGDFGAARLEFFSDPQGGGTEWRPGYIQSTDNGGFTGGLSFHVNGTGFDNRLADLEVMRLVNGRVGIGTATPASTLDVNGDLTVRGNFTVPGGLVRSVNGQTDHVTLPAGNGLEFAGNQFSLSSSGITITNTADGNHAFKAVNPPGSFVNKIALFGLAGEPANAWLIAPVGVHGESGDGVGVFGVSSGTEPYLAGVRGWGLGATTGIYGSSDSGRGIAGFSGSSGSALYGENTSATGFAGDFNGRVRINSQLTFGAATRQMIDLWGGVYGIGVQSGTHYFRTGTGGGDRFTWYQGGTHSDTGLDPGAGGTLLMNLDRGYLTLRGHGNEQPYIGGDGSGGDVEIGSRNAGILNAAFWNPAAGMYMNVFGRTFNPSSDRNAKQDFKPVDAAAILEKVIALPITEWAYKGEVATRHVGPVAQDFKEAFGVGSSDKSIATIDADGVALAAIQGLNQKLEETRAELKRRDAENTDLKARLQRLERLVEHVTSSR